MNDLVQMGVSFLALFLAAMAAAWLITTLKLRSKRCPEPAAGAGLRMRGQSGMYRTRVVETRGPFWVLAAPLMRDYYVPLHVGEKLTVECPVDDGVMFFRSVVRARDSATHTVIIDRPEGGRKTERRTEKRLSDPLWGPAVLEGAESVLVNLSTGGVKVETPANVKIGERVSLKLPWSADPVFGWVLETLPAGRQTVEARIRFEEPLTALPA